MTWRSLIALAASFAAALAVTGCISVNTFSASARAGDTVAVALGWNVPVTRQDLEIVITSGGSTFQYPPGDSNVRLVANFYPDPASRLIVGRETNQSLGVSANAYAQSLEASVTGGDKDYAQTMVLVNLPATLPSGPATVSARRSGVTIATLNVNVIGSGGSPHAFTGTDGTNTYSATPEMLRALERAELKTVTFSGPTVPYGIQLDLAYTGGTPWIVNPRGDLKSTSWASDGERIRVILLPANQVNPAQMSAFKFHVAGGVTGLEIVPGSVRAFDASGNAVAAVTPQLR